MTIITDYSKSFELLSKYDSGSLSTDGLNNEIIYVINYEDVKEANISTMLKENGISHSDFIDMIFSNPSVQGRLAKLPNEVWNSPQC